MKTWEVEVVREDRAPRVYVLRVEAESRERAEENAKAIVLLTTDPENTGAVVKSTGKAGYRTAEVRTSREAGS